jgi:hypothetical protein
MTDYQYILLPEMDIICSKVSCKENYSYLPTLRIEISKGFMPVTGKSGKQYKCNGV